MSTITNFNPIQSINFFLRPFGLGISSKQQMIAKTAMVAFAALTFNQMMMQTVNARMSNRECKDYHCPLIECSTSLDLLLCFSACYNRCDRNYP